MTGHWRKVTRFGCHFGGVFRLCCVLWVLALRTLPALAETQSGLTEPATAASPEPSPKAQEGASALAPRVYSMVIGHEVVHVVAQGDTPSGLARKYDVSTEAVLRINSIEDPRRLQIGKRLLLSNRQIVPAPFSTGLVIDLLRLRLYWVKDGSLVGSYPVAAGRPAWHTPAGLYKIIGRRRNPTWYVPASIQQEMMAQGLRVRKRVPPGPDNPLGKYWLQLSAPGIGIHGTNAPWSVGRYTTHGCIRLHEEHVALLFRQVPDGTPVAIVNEPVRLARTQDGHVYLQVFDRPGVWSWELLEAALRRLGLLEVVHTKRAQKALKDRWGVAVDVTGDTGGKEKREV